MPISIFQVDAFAEAPFTGNPAAVCLLENEASSAWMQQVAAEMNLSETAFVRKTESGFDLRWFTPRYEVDLCGHATLASAHVLWKEADAAAGPIQFQTRSGLLTCQQAGDLIELDFPATPPSPKPAASGLLEALGIGDDPIYVGETAFDKFVVVDSEEAVRSLTPDFTRLAKVDTRGVIVTGVCTSDQNVDFVSRFFAPTAGIDEDPVTGSAHCALGPYWHQQLGKTQLNAYQASQRGGRVQVTVDSDRIILAGRALTITKGSLLA